MQSADRQGVAEICGIVARHRGISIVARLSEEASSYHFASPASSRCVEFNLVESKSLQSSYESFLVSCRKYFPIIQRMLRPLLDQLAGSSHLRETPAANISYTRLYRCFHPSLPQRRAIRVTFSPQNVTTSCSTSFLECCFCRSFCRSLWRL